MDGWNTFSFPFGKLIFQGRTVSFGRVFFLLYAKVGQDSSRKKNTQLRNRKRLGKHFGNDEAQLRDHGVCMGL